MCEPTTLMAASLALSAGTAVMGYMQGNAQADAQESYNEQLRKQADEAYVRDLEALQLQQLQDEKASKQKVADNAKKAARAQSEAANLFAGRGVTGLSIDGLLADFERQEADYKDSVLDNLGARNMGRMQESEAAYGRLQSRYNGQSFVSRPSALSTGLKIAGAGVQTYADYKAGLPDDTST